MKHFLIAMSLGLSLSATAQSTVGFNITYPSDGRYESMRTFVKPIGEQSPQGTVELTRNDAGVATGTVTSDPSGLYNIYVADSRSQFSLPVYIAPGAENATFQISIDGFTTSTTLSDPANTALSAYNKSLTDKAINLNKNLDTLSNAQVRDILVSYTSGADSLAAGTNLPADVADYIRMWGYVSASDAYSMCTYMLRGKERDFGFSAADILPPADKTLDTPMALCFPSSMQTILSSLPKGTVEERLEALYSTYKTPGIRTKGSDYLVSSFLDSYNYDDGFDEGVNRLTAIVEKYGLPTKYIDTFKARRATIAGAPFPEIELVDRDGNKIDFSKFRGKYVYIDLWASWCGPCVKEVPYLQKLEKELEDSDVVFVSISIDSTREPWLKKMEQLNMHGNQLWNSDGNLPKQLNVKGIPHFLIYDREGKLHTYKALRPSNPELADILRSLK